MISLRGNPDFHRDSLTVLERAWYDKVSASIERSWDTATSRADSNDTYIYGRYFGDYNAALLMVLRATGDLSFLDRVLQLCNIAKAQLRDSLQDGSTDGNLGWWWQGDPKSPYYGTDAHSMDEAMTHGNIALITYALHVNRDLKPEYAEQADDWLDYLENHFLAKWYARCRNDSLAAWNHQSGFYKRFVHPRANQLRLAFYLWKITGKSFYLDRVEEIAGQLREHLDVVGEDAPTLRWKHQISGHDEGWQKIQYAQYFMRVVYEMYFENLNGLADPEIMLKFMRTFRDVVFRRSGRDAPSGMSLRIDGSGSTQPRIWGQGCLVRWDPSGRILELAASDFKAGSYGLSTAAYTLMGMSTRDQSK
ncbi:MAG: hypothetical protein KJ927_02540 [Candidatus Eisenbacteria bacterium]|nr:hypothetical protein [Candidatus Eisenbacteria bacterium]MBU1947569.1 hypothetical protein [Candidatus Eisenbacteria bacterium]